MKRLPLLLILACLSACTTERQIVMLNPVTGATAGCPVPGPGGGSGEFLIASSCLSACRRHGFHLTDGVRQANSSDDLPSVCN